MRKNKTMSWGLIIFWCIIFWPVGLFFLFKKLSDDKSATLNNSKTVTTISYVLIGMGVLYLLAASTGGSSMIVAALLFGGGGIWVNMVAKKMKLNGEKYKKYINLVINQRLTEIDNIAPAVGVSYEVAKADLQTMINSGYFIGATINESTREIMLSKPAVDLTTQVASIQAQTRVVACKSCGANNSIILGKNGECEYCGSPVEF